MLQAKT